MAITENDLSSLPALRSLLEENGLWANKKLGQHFLLDLNLTHKITRLAGDLTATHVVEVGPGPGGLSRAIAAAGPGRFTMIERDARFAPLLEPLAPFGAVLVLGDALKTDWDALAATQNLTIMSNLPYNIGTVLLMDWLEKIHLINQMVLMFQWEVAERLVASPRSSAYGRLAVMTQWRTQATLAMKIPASAFVPPPKIDSGVVVLKPKPPAGGAPSWRAMERVTAAAFGQRRKMLRQSLKSIFPDAENVLNQLDLAPTARAEELSVDDFVTLARYFEKPSDFKT